MMCFYVQRYLLANQHPRNITVIQKLSLGHGPLYESNGRYLIPRKMHIHNYKQNFTHKFRELTKSQSSSLHEPQVENSNTGRWFVIWK